MSTTVEVGSGKPHYRVRRHHHYAPEPQVTRAVSRTRDVPTPKEAIPTTRSEAAHIDAHDVDAYRGLQDAVAALIAGFDNPLYTGTEAAVRGRVKFHAPALDANIDWDAAVATAGALAKI
ncbi:hypothetical protein DEJ00_17720 [Curtobacterium sp. MCLR17_039]|uniref:hypothetical protein n=1 Tax=Curtobacterium sp. MCLR17_039 TaxID=2175624 RepID=UPI000DA71352|nr:hypothetical protein [Curtobacterium sp. MCLR17_039]PZE86104.1 hypothetical protein DEJ00_17720 [Curtobacterium sp. MCLR17_039]